MTDEEGEAHLQQALMATKAVEAAVNQLSEFGNVQILLSISTADGVTLNIVSGSGDLNARIQMARSFVTKSDIEEELRIEQSFCGQAMAEEDEDE